MNTIHQKKAIIFDGDDTLWENQVFYDEAKDQFYKLMDSQGFDRTSVKEKLSEIDRANVAKLGLSRKRFPTSMRETYVHFCTQEHRNSDPNIEALVFAIGAAVFQRKPRPVDDVEKVLALLKKIYDLYLYSAGDREIQAEKLQSVGLAKHFQGIHFVERKNSAELQRILDEHNLDIETTWMAGNSVRSDINPALQLGLPCIWVHTHSWDYDQDIMLDGFVKEVSSIREIPALVCETNFGSPIIKLDG